jgi:hypothetical protein
MTRNSGSDRREFDLVINLKAAKQIGLIILANVLVRADKESDDRSI